MCFASVTCIPTKIVKLSASKTKYNVCSKATSKNCLAFSTLSQCCDSCLEANFYWNVTFFFQLMRIYFKQKIGFVSHCSALHRSGTLLAIQEIWSQMMQAWSILLYVNYFHRELKGQCHEIFNLHFSQT